MRNSTVAPQLLVHPRPWSRRQASAGQGYGMGHTREARAIPTVQTYVCLQSENIVCWKLYMLCVPASVSLIIKQNTSFLAAPGLAMPPTPRARVEGSR